MYWVKSYAWFFTISLSFFTVNIDPRHYETTCRVYVSSYNIFEYSVKFT